MHHIDIYKNFSSHHLEEEKRERTVMKSRKGSGKETVDQEIEQSSLPQIDKDAYT